MADTPILEMLADIRDFMGADAASVWDVDMGGRHTVRWFSSRDQAAPVLDVAQQGLVTWAAAQVPGEVSSQVLSGQGSPAAFVATPLGVAGSRVLVVAADAGMIATKEQYRHWLPRFAARLVTLAELVAAHHGVARAERQTAALVEAATRVHENRNIEAVGECLCLATQTMTGTKRVALVQWDGTTQAGTVAFATRGHLVSAGTPVTTGSQIGNACAGDYMLVLEDASNRGDAFTVYGGTEIPRPLGSLVIVPLRGADGVMGALVAEGDVPGQIVASDGQNLKLLGLLASAALETVWEIQQINRLARTDPLTGLANRQAFEERLQQLITETDRFGGAGSLVVLDVDHFKHVNDTYGHQVGDAVLQRLAGLLRRYTRTVDLCARYGGEELAILLPQTNLAGARQLAERLREQIAQGPVIVEGREISVTVSLGVASYPEGARSKDELFAAADRALYGAKRGGRNRVVVDVV